jgi:predicted DNA-binding transcriptional regulator AlpA
MTLHGLPVADPDEILSPRATRGMLGDISEATLWRMRRRGDIAEPIHVSPGRVGWRRRDVLAYIESRQTAPTGRQIELRRHGGR